MGCRKIDSVDHLRCSEIKNGDYSEVFIGLVK